MEGFSVNSGTMLDTTAESPLLRVLNILADEGHGICDIDYIWYFRDYKYLKIYRYHSDAKLYIRTLEKIKEKIPTGFQGKMCACIHKILWEYEAVFGC
jgi:hypothetical protein